MYQNEDPLNGKSLSTKAGLLNVLNYDFKLNLPIENLANVEAYCLQSINLHTILK